MSSKEKHLGTKQLETGRLVLRRFRETDANDVFANWSGNPAVGPYVSWSPTDSIEKSTDMLLEWISAYADQAYYKWAIEYKEEAIGFVEVRPRLYSYELGYLIADSFWGQGFATEAVEAVLKFVFEECHFHKVFAMYATMNPASGKVLRKMGMTSEGTLRKQYPLKEGGFCDLHIFGILAEEWIARGTGGREA